MATLSVAVTTPLTWEVKAPWDPTAALLVVGRARMAATAVAVLTAAGRAAHGEGPADERSGDSLALAVRRVPGGMMIALPPARGAGIAGRAVPEFAALVRGRAARVDLRRERKSRRGPTKPPPKKSRSQNGGQGSTHKGLAEREH